MTTSQASHTNALRQLDLLERSGDKALIAFDIQDKTVKLPTPLPIAEARVAVAVAIDNGATRVSVARFDTTS